MRITLFDNHDSFTWNLAHDLERLNGVEVEVVREGSWEDRVLGDHGSFGAVAWPRVAARTRSVDGRHGPGD